jgi:hypothetical protein
MLTVATLVLCVLMLPATAHAHVPFIESAQRSDVAGSRAVPYPQAQTLPSPTISRAIYGYLAPGAKFDAYTFTVAQPVTTDVALIVPKRLGLQGFRPSMRIYAEGSDEALTVPDPGLKQRRSFYEPFSVASFWDGPTIKAVFKPGERYYVVIDPPLTGRSSGPYVLTFGGAEQFSAGDWATSAAAMPFIWLGSWAGGPVRPGLNVCGVILAVLLAAAIGLWVRGRRRRRSAELQPAETKTAAAEEQADADNGA